MGYPYDSEEDVFEDTDFQKKMMKLSLQQLQQRNIIKKKQMGGANSPSKIPKDEEAKQGDKNGPGQTAQDDLDDMEITKLWMYLFVSTYTIDSSGGRQLAKEVPLFEWKHRISKIKLQKIITIIAK